MPQWERRNQRTAMQQPVHNELTWVHRSFDEGELDDDCEIRLPAPVAETLIFFGYWLHWISRSKAIESLKITPEAFKLRLDRWLEELPDDYKDAAKELSPPD